MVVGSSPTAPLVPTICTTETEIVDLITNRVRPVGAIDMTETPLQYQKEVLETVVDEAVASGLTSETEAEQLRDRLESLESMRSVDRLWDDLSQEYELLEPAEPA
jgi:hypothetical protein